MTMRKNSAALWLLVGDGFSAFGTWIDFLAILTLAVYLYHVTPYEMALVSAVGLLPGMLAASRIGKLCDRANPKQLLLFSIVFRVVATGGILFCGEFVLFLALVAVRSLFTTVAGPAINVMAMRAVDAPERPKFYALSTLSTIRPKSSPRPSERCLAPWRVSRLHCCCRPCSLQLHSSHSHAFA